MAAASSSSISEGLPVVPARVHVHNAELYREVMESCDWNSNNASAPLKGPQKRRSASPSDRSAKQREAFIQKQSVREHELKQKFEAVKRETERRVRERALQKEQEFEERYARFVNNNETLVAAVDGAIKADEAWRQRKRERLFNEWTTKIFEPMQAEISSQLNQLSREELEQRRRHMFECFLRESNRKANGLFRDIIIESDYDPLAQAKSVVVKFKAPSIADDPTKNRATREMGDRLASGLISVTQKSEGGGSGGSGGASSSGKGLGGSSKNAVPVTMWDRMHATPYGRYSDETTDAPARKPDFLKSAVVMSHFDVPRGDQGAKLVREENSLRGKKILPPAQLPSIKECFSASSS